MAFLQRFMKWTQFAWNRRPLECHYSKVNLFEQIGSQNPIKSGSNFTH